MKAVQLPKQMVAIQGQLHDTAQNHRQHGARPPGETPGQTADGPGRRKEQQRVAADQQQLVEQQPGRRGQLEETPKVDGQRQPGEKPVKSVDTTGGNERHDGFLGAVLIRFGGEPGDFRPGPRRTLVVLP